MKLVQEYPILGSSANPEKLSLTIKSVGLMLIPLIVIVSKGFGFEILEADLIKLLEVILLFIGGVGTIIGLGRKYINSYRK